MQANAAQNDIYARRINTVISYVRQNLDGDLSLDALSRVGCFSKFHFHRVFKAITDETVGDMVLRMRLERAANLLRTVPKLSVRSAAIEAGFTSAPVFSRAFRKHFGISARQWDRKDPLENSKNGQFRDEFPRYTLEDLESHAFEVKIRSLPKQRLAYIRVHDAYSSFDRIKDAYYRLIAWYRQRGGGLDDISLYGMSQDNPDVTPLKLCRFDWCVKVPADQKGAGVVNITDFPACRIATIRCVGGFAHENKVIQYLFRYWLPRSRYQPANLPGMEIYRRQPAEMGWEEYDIDCAVPVIPL
ncbi:MAG TPA: AraC family transcriptional regulator [Pyrinomonadaceae bacterium]|jgi:AraC family transcriptional regulator|nr:AraC family transcriptional regulator [Pyrinomonadaceae bacterium]